MYSSNDLGGEHVGCIVSGILAVVAFVVFLAGFVVGRYYERSGTWWQSPVTFGKAHP